MIRRVLTISILILSAFGVPDVATAQTDAEYLSAINFRFANPGARARGMGGVLVPLASDDATATFVNPAGLASFDRWQFSMELTSDEDEFPAPRVETGVSILPSGAFQPEGPPRRRTISNDSNFVSFASYLRPVELEKGRFVFGVFYSNRLDADSGSSDVFIDGAFFPETDSSQAFRPVASSVSAKNEILGFSIGVSVLEELSIGASVGMSHLEFMGSSRRGAIGAPDLISSIQSSTVDSEYDVFVTLGALYRPTDNFSFGVSWQKQTGYDMSNTLDSLDNDDLDRAFESEFTIPTRVAAGLAYKSGDWVWGLEIDHIQYSDLFEEARGRTFFAEFETDSSYGYRIPDVTEVHLGVEKQFEGDKSTWFFRVGYWRDEAHVPFYSGEDPLLLAWSPQVDEDIDHLTVGIGFEAERYAIDLAVDHSPDAGTDVLLSWIYKQKRAKEKPLVAVIP